MARRDPRGPGGTWPMQLLRIQKEKGEGASRQRKKGHDSICEGGRGGGGNGDAYVQRREICNAYSRMGKGNTGN